MKAVYVWLVSASLLAVGCGNGNGGNNDGGTDTEVTQAEGTNYRFVANSLQLPTSRTQYAFDLNGDGNVENQLGNIISGLSSLLNVQSAVDTAVAAGQAIILFNVQSGDANLTSATNVGTTVYLGNQQANPDFSGNGTFTINPAVSGARFLGRITSSRFTSNNPATTRLAPVTVSLNLPLVDGVEPLRLQLNGARVQWNSTGNTGLAQVQINGSLKRSQLENDAIPVIASLLTSLIVANGPNAAQIKTIFDTGNCTGAAANDNVIATCEVAGNAIIQNLLIPDVQIFAADGTTYQPCRQASGCAADSLSVGVQFTAVRANFTTP